jgi:histidyl-tRNA synthetase
VLRAIDKLDRLSLAGVGQLLGEGRKDESGDFTRGAGLAPNHIVGILGLIESKQDWRDAIAGAELRLNDTRSGSSGASELEEIAKLVDSTAYTDRVKIDMSVVRGLEYYTGPVFEAQLTFEVPNERGEPVVFGSVGGGGRYDGLVGRFRGEDVPATGFSVGVSRLAAALKAIGKLGDEGFSGPVVVTVMDRERMADYQKMVADLRNAKIPAELYLGASGMKAQLKYADRRDAPAVIIAGSNEFDSGKIQIKDLAAGKAKAAGIGDNQAWRDERPGQFEIPRAELVSEVRKLLERQQGE